MAALAVTLVELRFGGGDEDAPDWFARLGQQTQSLLAVRSSAEQTAVEPVLLLLAAVSALYVFVQANHTG